MVKGILVLKDGTAIEGEGFGEPGRILIAATGVVQNSETQLEQLGGDRVTLRDRWGREPILCEGIPATVTLPVAANCVRFFPLDSAGNRRAAVTVSGDDDRALVELHPRHRTVWYEVELSSH